MPIYCNMKMMKASQKLLAYTHLSFGTSFFHMNFQNEISQINKKVEKTTILGSSHGFPICPLPWDQSLIPGMARLTSLILVAACALLGSRFTAFLGTRIKGWNGMEHGCCIWVCQRLRNIHDLHIIIFIIGMDYVMSFSVKDIYLSRFGPI